MLKWISLLLVAGVVSSFGAEESAKNPEAAKRLSLQEALVMTLENNTSLRIEKLDPRIVRKNETVASAEFDPSFSASVDSEGDSATATNGVQRSAQDISAGVGLSKKFATGTSVALDLDVNRNEFTASGYDDRRYTDYVSGELKITQSLLRGRGLSVNLASVRKARINTAISEQELRRYIETLIYNVTTAYWNLFLEQKKLAVYQESYELALAHEREVEVFIRNGQQAEIELATVKGESSSRREKLIQARGAIDKRRLALLGSLNYKDLTAEAWTSQLIPVDDPHNVYDTRLGPVDSYVDVALLKRPEIAAAELKVDRQDLELIATRDGLLPKLDFFISMGRTEYSQAFLAQDDAENHNDSVSVGLDLSFDFGRRAEKAHYAQDVLYKERYRLALENLEDSVSQEVRQAYIECETSLETIDAVAITRDLREQSLKTQTIKFELGKATNTDIANAQRDLLQSQINYTEAIIDYVKSRLRLHYLDGSLIERSALEVPSALAG